MQVRKWQWAYPIIEGVSPCQRGGHSATLSGASIVIFGGHYYTGKNEGYAYLNDTYVLDVNANKFTVLNMLCRNLKFRELLLRQDMLILRFWLVRRLLFLVEGVIKAKYLEIFMLLILSQ